MYTDSSSLFPHSFLILSKRINIYFCIVNHCRISRSKYVYIILHGHVLRVIRKRSDSKYEVIYLLRISSLIKMQTVVVSAIFTNVSVLSTGNLIGVELVVLRL